MLTLIVENDVCKEFDIIACFHIHCWSRRRICGITNSLKASHGLIFTSLEASSAHTVRWTLQWNGRNIVTSSLDIWIFLYSLIFFCNKDQTHIWEMLCMYLILVCGRSLCIYHRTLISQSHEIQSSTKNLKLLHTLLTFYSFSDSVESQVNSWPPFNYSIWNIPLY